MKLPADLDVTRLDGLVWAREYNRRQLRSVIQFEGVPFRISDMDVYPALAIHERVIMSPVLAENNGRYSVGYTETVVPSWANCYFASGFGVVDKLANRSFVEDTINHGLRLVIPVHGVAIDTARLSFDHRDQWIRSFSERQGRVDRGTLFGEGVEQDNVFGPELGRANCRSVGWITDFFSDPVKVKVTPKGSVTLWADVPPELFIRFIRMEILPYVTHF
ncbi:MAG: hypothetical protein QXZ70_07685 [Candidatus Bathyarchaeia archaeon]